MYKTVSLSQLQVLYRSIQHIGGGVSSASGTNQRRVGERPVSSIFKWRWRARSFVHAAANSKQDMCCAVSNFRPETRAHQRAAARSAPPPPPSAI